jgi:putative ABC transport system permease protein
LGADQRDILRLVVGQGLNLTLIGIGLGIVAALIVTRVGSLLTDLLYQVNARDWMTFATCGAAVAFMALAATYLPARKAMRVDPTEALRN